MSDDYDSWRHDQPAAPHAPSHDRRVLLTRAERFRAHWHGLLQLAQLRPS